MEWAIGVLAANDHLVVDIARGDGQREQVPVSELYRRGVPALATGPARRVTLPFAQWRRALPEEVEAPFRLAGLDAPLQAHQVYGFKGGRRRFLVPALVLMRAIFRPSRHLLPSMFLPQALDQVSHLDLTRSPPVVVSEMSWATSSARERFSDWAALLEWLHLYPCARKMAASVHEHAMRGELGLTLPSGFITVSVRGIDVAHTTIATHMCIAEIAPATATDTPGVIATASYTLHGQARRHIRPPVATVSKYRVPVRQDGTVELSDSEWEEVEALLRAARSVWRPPRLCQRRLMNNILRKLGFGCPWRELTGPKDNWHNAAYAFRVWSQSGVMRQVIEVLRKHRDKSCSS